MASLGEIRYVIRMRTNKYTAYNSPLLDSFLLMTFPVMPSPQLLKRLSDRYRFCWLIQHFGNIFSALCQHPVIKLLAIGSLQPLGRFQLLISPNSLTGDIQFPGIHIRRLLLQLGVLCQCRIQFSSIFFLLLVQHFQGRLHGRNMLFDLIHAMIGRTVKLIE